MRTDNTRGPGTHATAVFAVFFLLLVFRLDAIPPPWWDEGWTMSVARNLVTDGFYGHLLMGEHVGPELSGHFPVVLLTALSFKVFGVGVVQARLAFVAVTILFVFLFFRLLTRLFSREIAVFTMIALAFFPVQWDLVPQLIGRQVLGEMVMLFFVVLGLSLLERSEGQKPLSIVFSILSFGIALISKSQLPPFLCMGFAVPLVVLLFSRRDEWKVMLTVLVGSFVVAQGLTMLKDVLLLGHTLPASHISGLTQASAVVLDRVVRLATFRFALVTGLPVTAALYYGAHRFRLLGWKDGSASWQEVVKLVLFSMSASWFLWYIGLSIGWGRYLMPAITLATPFVVDLLADLFDGNSFEEIYFELKEAVQAKRISRPVIRILAGLLIMLLLCRQTVIGIEFMLSPGADASYRRVVSFINNKTPQGSTVETYESELLFLLQRPVHFPPAQLNVALIRNDWTSAHARYDYDVTRLTADYLVVGVFGQRLYPNAIVSGRYRQLRTFGHYVVYEKFIPTAP
jgi:hypothetical protein